mmetsp:Transcript_12192/g.33561  ORF Transcript_12192/g.33561 Transcript_12192/m.33561 type:complete len:223 (-) Transcript_12192:177-845(-)
MDKGDLGPRSQGALPLRLPRQGRQQQRQAHSQLLPAIGRVHRQGPIIARRILRPRHEPLRLGRPLAAAIRTHRCQVLARAAGFRLCRSFRYQRARCQAIAAASAGMADVRRLGLGPAGQFGREFPGIVGGWYSPHDQRGAEVELVLHAADGAQGGSVLCGGLRVGTLGSQAAGRCVSQQAAAAEACQVSDAVGVFTQVNKSGAEQRTARCSATHSSCWTGEH